MILTTFTCALALVINIESIHCIKSCIRLILSNRIRCFFISVNRFSLYRETFWKSVLRIKLWSPRTCFSFSNSKNEGCKNIGKICIQVVQASSFSDVYIIRREWIFEVSLAALGSLLFIEIQWNGLLRAKGKVIHDTGHHLTSYPTEITWMNMEIHQVDQIDSWFCFTP